jgi:tRNA-binding EMAP/Myf-like protein
MKMTIMAMFEVKVVRIDSVEKHPDADALTMNRVGGYTAITNLRDDGSPRFAAGDLAVYVPTNAVLPEAILKQYGYWDHENNRGFLSGEQFNRVRPRKLRGIYSEGLLLPLLSD